MAIMHAPDSLQDGKDRFTASCLVPHKAVGFEEAVDHDLSSVGCKAAWSSAQATHSERK